MANTLLIMAGGTGGHIYPALSVAHRLQERGWTIVWLGAKTGMEARIVPPHGFSMAWVQFTGVRGKGWRRVLGLPWSLLVACYQSAQAIFRFRPDVILGMGGYVSFPGALMAVVLNRPLIIHEQNAVAGLANRVLAYFATRVLAGFPGAFAENRKAQWVGNPVRADIATLPDPSQRSQDPSTRLRILILGGSQGAAALNTLIPESLALMTENERPSVTHQAGAAHAQNLIDLYARFGVKAHIVPYIEDMASSYQAADLVICRAGASTVAEIAAAGVASLFVPLPTAVDDHQTLNAQFLVNRGAAHSMAQSELTAERLSQWLRHLKKSDLISMAAAARLAAKNDATQTVVQICEELAHAL